MNQINWPKIDSDHLIVFSKQMFELENDIFSKGMPVESLMEKAGLGISDWFLKRTNLLKNGVIIFIGPGHNGGDGAVLARELFLKGFPVKFFCPYPIKKKLTQKQVEYITSIGISSLNITPSPRENDLWVDAIFGNNQKKSIDNKIISLFHEKNDGSFGKIVSIDVPSGLCPNTGLPFSSDAVKSSFTLSIGFKKIGILQDSAIPYVGKIQNIDLGFSEKQINSVRKKVLSLSSKDFPQLRLTLPSNNYSKYKRGRTLLIVGSEKYLGATYLAIKGALASGVGSVKVIIPKSIASSLWQIAPEIVIENSMESSASKNSLIYDSLKNVDLTHYESIAIGPGIGLDTDDWNRSVKFLLDFKGLLILDADALNRITNSKLGCQFFKNRKSKTWITPHKGEFSRLFPHLCGINNVDLALKAACEYQISVLLKGAHSIIASIDGQAWQIYNTDSDSARAGLGDLLTGFLSGMSALEISSGGDLNTESFAKYVFIHSYSALNCANGSSASIISNELSRVVREIKTRQMS